MSTLFLINQLEFAGAQKIFLEVVDHLAKSGEEAAVCVLYDKTDALRDLRRQYPEVTFYDLNMIGAGSAPLKALSGVRGIVKLARLIRKQRPDTVVTFLLYSNILGPVVAGLCGTRRILTSQRNVNDYRPRIEQLLNRAVSNLPIVERIICVSEGTREYCIRLGIREDKLVTIRNGVRHRPPQNSSRQALRSAIGVQTGEVLLGTVGRLDPQKGHAALIAAAALLQKRGVPFRLIAAGDGPLATALREKTQSAGLSDRITFLGVRSDIPDLLDAMDIFVFPSLFEGIPNALIEAMAAGTPIVATTAPGIVEVIDDMKEGLLVPPNDAASLADALTRLIDEPRLAETLAEGAARRAETEMSMDTMAERYRELICPPKKRKP